MEEGRWCVNGCTKWVGWCVAVVNGGFINGGWEMVIHYITKVRLVVGSFVNCAIIDANAYNFHEVAF
ncbi:hypothetical protein L2E82_41893 [Cichorium intybus]|uniref:Uncharacterized protein n=1 Tax=Cichorium intybus TaxID=13427 RepID=A0ACB8ZKA1_CICIN|nr:hypothetical protein L2E82_41893 [Cichorium intybus]